MARILNLDALIPQTSKIVLDNVEHEVQPTSTEVYLKLLSAKQQMAKALEGDEVAQTRQSIELILLVIPTLKRERLMKLPVNALMALVELIEGEMEGAEGEEGEGAPADVEGERLGE